MSLRSDLERLIRATPRIARVIQARQIYVELVSLPDGLQKALKALGYRKRDIGAQAGTSFTWGVAGGSGKRGLVALIDVDSGRVLDSELGSWGGPSGFGKSRVDDLNSKQTLQEGQAAFSGYDDGSYGSLTLHPGYFGLLQDKNKPTELSPDEKKALEFLGYTSSYRKQEFEREGLGVYGPRNPLVLSLIEKGLVEAKGAGLRLTTKGRNLQ